MPLTGGRTSDVSNAETRPGSSVVKVTGSAFSTTTPTSAGGASGGAASPPQPANISTATPSNIRVVLDSSMLHPERLENDGMNRSEEHTSELHSLMRTTSAVLFLKK